VGLSGEGARVKKQPWLKFYPADWRADASLRMCSPAARLLWLEMLCLMHEADPRGHLLVKGRRPTTDQLGMLSGITGGIVPELISELREAEVFDEVGGVIVSRKMVRDTKVSKDQSDRVEKRWERARSGNTGGNTQIVPQMPDTRSQIKDAEDAGADDWPAGKPFDHAQLLVVEAEAVNFSLDRAPGLAQGITALHRWRRDGASWEHDVVPVVKALAQKARSPIKSWSYFEDAIATNVAATRAAMTIPEHSDVQRPRAGQPNGHDTRKAGAMAFLAEIRGDNPGDDSGG
jgi:hypothetical protein